MIICFVFINISLSQSLRPSNAWIPGSESLQGSEHVTHNWRLKTFPRLCSTWNTNVQSILIARFRLLIRMKKSTYLLYPDFLSASCLTHLLLLLLLKLNSSLLPHTLWCLLFTATLPLKILPILWDLSQMSPLWGRVPSSC